MTSDIKRNAVLSFIGGNLTVSLNGPTVGWGTFELDGSEIEIRANDNNTAEYATFDIPKTELMALRDFLNKTFPVQS